MQKTRVASHGQGGCGSARATPSCSTGFAARSARTSRPPRARASSISRPCNGIKISAKHLACPSSCFQPSCRRRGRTRRDRRRRRDLSERRRSAGRSFPARLSKAGRGKNHLRHGRVRPGADRGNTRVRRPFRAYPHLRMAAWAGGARLRSGWRRLTAGAAVEWLRGLGLLDTFEELDAFEGPSAASRGVMFVPAQSGLGCPHWDRSARGLWIGMNLRLRARISAARWSRGSPSGPRN